MKKEKFFILGEREDFNFSHIVFKIESSTYDEPKTLMK